MKVTSAEFLKSAAEPSQYPEESIPEIAFAGRSNVGKSSLINTLLNRKRLARTSTVPGKTRLINFFKINDRLCFVDLPGYGYAKVPLSVKKTWGPMVERYLKERKNLCLVILILDIRREPSDDDLALVDWLRHYDVNFIYVLTKMDKISKNQVTVRRRTIMEHLNPAHDEGVIMFSSKTGYGKDDLWEKIMKATKR
ncbi:MAG: YihA family ribosome biogenesis GTP-binding protein [Deltaproteobacteria bacterium]|nr:YihA family ribosome biogenesis GTP-binding protein [Deltaproteobacteria bacterium]